MALQLMPEMLYVVLLLNHGANANATTSSGLTVLHSAAQSCPLAIMSSLLQYGALPALTSIYQPAFLICFLKCGRTCLRTGAGI